jgi:hypothetical protein
MIKHLYRILTVVLAVSIGFGAAAQDKVVRTVLDMGRSDNRTMEHADHLANVIGGRIVGSASLTQAEAWVKEQFESWGLEVMVQEAGTIAVGFSRGPWYGRVYGDSGMNLHFGTPAYTAGTHGRVKGPVLIEPHSRRELERMKGALKGAWVLLDAESNGMAIDRTQKARDKRDEIKSRNEEIERRNMEIQRWNWEHRDSVARKPLPYEKATALFYDEMVEAGVLGFIRAAKVPLQVMYDRAGCFDLTMETLPTACDILLDEAQFAALKRRALRRESFEIEFDIRNHFFRGPVAYHNVIGVMRGSKYPKEYVLAGGHLDSYDNGTGAVDDGNGVSVTMEAARLLAASGAKPKRTLLFCIWTGEEFGLLGSKFFVENKTVPMESISNYFNRDGGPLMATGVSVPPAMYDDFVKVCKPLEDYCADVPFVVEKRNGQPGPRPTKPGGSDHAHFAMNGVPTISFRETDPDGMNFDYREIWHTESDIYNKLIPRYMEHSAVVTAVTMYGIANLDHLLSRDGLYTD